MAKGNGKWTTKGVLHTYKTYLFKTKDPVIDEIRGMVNDDGRSYTALANDAGVSPTTLRNWFEGDTRKPTSATIEAVGRAMGFARVWQKFEVLQNTPLGTPKATMRKIEKHLHKLAAAE